MVVLQYEPTATALSVKWISRVSRGADEDEDEDSMAAERNLDGRAGQGRAGQRFLINI